MFDHSSISHRFRTIIYCGWNWIVKRTYVWCCVQQINVLDDTIPFDAYATSEDKHVIIELLNEYDD